MTMTLFTLGFKMHFGDLNTSGQPRHTVVHTCVYHAAQRGSADHYISLPADKRQQYPQTARSR